MRPPWPDHGVDRASALLLAVLLTALLPAIVRAASFDCTRAAHPVERAICASDVLGRLDERLAAAWAAALEGTADRAPLLQDQRAWSRDARRDCRDDGCIERAWSARIERLERWNTFVAPPAEVAGRWTLPRTVPVLDASRWVERRANDCLDIARRADGTLALSLNLVRTNGHGCGLRGTVVPVADGLELVPDPGAGSTACRLRVRFKPATIMLQDPDDACRALACGRRAGIDGTEFLRSARGTEACRP